MRRLTAASLLVALLLLPGCGDGSRGQVSGTVTLDGQAVENGVITFLPTGGTTGPSTSVEIKGGRYEIGREKGPVVGTNRVEILVYRKTGKKIREMTGGGQTDEIVQAAPPVYNAQSTLTREIKAGPNELNFELLTKP
jgi:hypothetical protein